MICLFVVNSSFAARVTGKITDENNQLLPYVIVYVTGTSNGTTANSEGIYSIDLDKGEYEISFRMIGYTLMTKKITISSDQMTLDVQLKSETVKLKEVTIVAGEDPAYEIIRQAQNKRKFYRDQIKLYRSNAYVKSTQQLTEFPNRIFGQEVNIGEMMDTSTKIFYLSESVSELTFKAPASYKEIMISSKVSGEPKTYSFNQATSVLINFYDNLVDISGLTPRGIVSPISANSLFYYKFRLEGTFTENGILVNKISVIPKRKSDPIFFGTIYIAEDSWRIYSADLFITKEQQMEFVDTFRIKQNFIKVNEETWMPFSHQFNYSFSAFGFKGNGVVLGVFSDYNLKPNLGKMVFDGEVMKVDETANKKDSSYWQETRPVPLTDIEIKDYHIRDSSLAIRESKTYLDSIDKKSNKFTFGSVLTGYYWENSYRHISVDVTSPLQKITFNTVEGWGIGLAASYRNGFGKEDRRSLTIDPSVRYGFSNTHFNGHVAMTYRYNTQKLSTLFIDGGTDLVQFNKSNPISELVNSMYSLLAEKNYMKVYEKEYLKASHKSELFNGFSLTVGAEYAHRKSIENFSDYSFKKIDDRDYLSNDPYHPTTDSLRFPDNNALTGEIVIRYRPGQEYISRPDGKYIIGSKWPDFRVSYIKGLYKIAGDIDYDLIEAGLTDEVSLGLFGTLKGMVTYGYFLNRDRLEAMDLKHFNGNKTWFSDFRLNDFKNLDYYTESTNGYYLELHAEENFGGFILNKIPLIRKLKLQEIAGVHYLHTETLDQYFEFSLGVEKLGLMRAELFTSLADGKKGTVGFLVGFKKSFN